MTGLGLQQLIWRAWPNIVAQYMSGFLKMVWMSTLAPWHFSQKIHRIFLSINHRQSVNTQPTHPPCLCLTGWLSASKCAGHIWPRLTCKENRHFQWAKGHSLWPSKTFCLKLDTVLKNPDIYWPGMPEKCVQLAAASSKPSPWLVWGYSSWTGRPDQTL